MILRQVRADSTDNSNQATYLQGDRFPRYPLKMVLYVLHELIGLISLDRRDIWALQQAGSAAVGIGRL